MDVVAHIKENIERYGLLREGKPVIVAISGGADSVALLVALHQLGYECIAAHCNYHLRGEESNRDMRHVQAVCSQMGVDLYVRDFDVHERCQATGESVEMACREMRYGWFADLLDRQRAQAIAVAHHREDNVETFFLNLMRGSGITGLTGMRWRNGYVVRPMLDLSRADIERCLSECGIGYVVDSTNAQNDFARNRLRNVVIPALSDNFPGAIDGILASMGYLSENRDFYVDAMAQKAAEYRMGNDIDLARLIAAEKHHRLILFEMLRPMGFNITHVDGILASAKKSGLTFTAGDVALQLDRGTLHIAGLDALRHDDEEVQVMLTRDILSPISIHVTELPVTQFRPERDTNIAYFDADILCGNPRFTLRHWRRGDRMTPFGMDCDKLVSDIFADAKYSAADKRRAWLLTRDGEIIWIVGLRASAHFSIIPETRRYLELRKSL